MVRRLKDKGCIEAGFGIRRIAQADWFIVYYLEKKQSSIANHQSPMTFYKLVSEQDYR
ncbi:hypothetical protein [Limnofasciculus baicalensis]|uniref:Uncharacterized protein n=1 Tax=Limnofasciculus baicalensis BBK-W-15 TaxID=2699891 RepID=A0AAE3KM55_9CYAN|nr:hypothetical protein [Limnofasciculus baicalensis]MCP2728849.1 hypothetical protein [Limnofasciculus baicalensis BBK-W-15]